MYIATAYSLSYLIWRRSTLTANQMLRDWDGNEWKQEGAYCSDFKWGDRCNPVYANTYVQGDSASAVAGQLCAVNIPPMGL